MTYRPALFLFIIAILLAGAGEITILYTSSLEAAVKNEMAAVAERRQKAETRIAQEKARIEEATAQAAGKRQKAEAELATQKARIATEEAANAAVLETAKADLTRYEKIIAAAEADNAKDMRYWEFVKAKQIASIEKSKAAYAERQRKAEADQRGYEATTRTEIAKNSDVKQSAEAQGVSIESMLIDAEALFQQWQANCRINFQSRGLPAGNAVARCQSIWFDYITR